MSEAGATPARRSTAPISWLSAARPTHIEKAQAVEFIQGSHGR